MSLARQLLLVSSLSLLAGTACTTFPRAAADQLVREQGKEIREMSELSRSFDRMGNSDAELAEWKETVLQRLGASGLAGVSFTWDEFDSFDCEWDSYWKTLIERTTGELRHSRSIYFMIASERSVRTDSYNRRVRVSRRETVLDGRTYLRYRYSFSVRKRGGDLYYYFLGPELAEDPAP